MMQFKFAVFEFVEEIWFVADSNFMCDFSAFEFVGIVDYVHEFILDHLEWKIKNKINYFTLLYFLDLF